MDYRSPKPTPRETPEDMFQHEFHPSVSSASGKWQACECHNGDFDAHFSNLQRVLREILAEDKRKKAL